MANDTAESPLDYGHTSPQYAGKHYHRYQAGENTNANIVVSRRCRDCTTSVHSGQPKGGTYIPGIYDSVHALLSIRRSTILARS